MSGQLKTILLYGDLAVQFGRVHKFAVDSIAEAMRAMCVMVPGFERELMNSRDFGIEYAVFRGKKNLRVDQYIHPIGSEDIRIAPVIRGSKQAGVLQSVIGIVLIVVGLIITGGTFGAGAPFGSALIMMGGSMLVGGVIQLLSPQQGGLSSKDSVANGASYNFNGPVNVEAQGNPEPILWGEFITGSVVISGGIYAEDQA
jgi:predicted phage tail protein